MVIALASILAIAAVASDRSADPPGWKRIDVQEAGFSATFPGQPSRSEFPTQLAGRPARARTFLLDRGDVRWAVTVMETGGLLSRQETDLWPEGMASFIKDRVRTSQVFHQGRKAVEVEQRADWGSALMRFIPGEQRLYSVVVVVKTGPLPKETGRFVEAFRIIPVVAGPQPPPSTPPDRWLEYSPESAQFAARFPSAPSEQPGETPDGVATRAFVAEQDGVRYSVLRVPISGVGGSEAAVVDHFINKMRDDFVRASGKPVIGERCTVSTFPCRDMTFSQPGATGIVRVIVTPEAIYKIAVLATAGEAGAGQARFVDSFRIVRR